MPRIKSSILRMIKLVHCQGNIFDPHARNSNAFYFMAHSVLRKYNENTIITSHWPFHEKIPARVEVEFEDGHKQIFDTSEYNCQDIIEELDSYRNQIDFKNLLEEYKKSEKETEVDVGEIKKEIQEKEKKEEKGEKEKKEEKGGKEKKEEKGGKEKEDKGKKTSEKKGK